MQTTQTFPSKICNLLRDAYNIWLSLCVAESALSTYKNYADIIFEGLKCANIRVYVLCYNVG